MASQVDICNLALSHVGDTGIITAIEPPDGSVQAARCSVFYPRALGTLLEARDWSFALRRSTLADLDDPAGHWLYRYAYPANCARVSKVLLETSEVHEPSEPFTTETNDAGDVTILTNAPLAEVLYVVRITDTSKFTEAFVECFGWKLASLLAGPLIKGKAGVMVAKYCNDQYLYALSVAGTSDASQHKPDQGYVPAGVAARA